MESTHMGDVDIYVKDSKHLNVPNGKALRIEQQNVYFVTRLKKNLMSVNQITKSGNVAVDFLQHGCMIKRIKDGKILAMGVKHGTLTYLKTVDVVGTNYVNMSDKVMKWHRRLCHLPFAKVI